MGRTRTISSSQSLRTFRPGGSYSTANTNSLMGDTIHPNKTAQADWALLVTTLLTAKAT